MKILAFVATLMQFVKSFMNRFLDKNPFFQFIFFLEHVKKMFKSMFKTCSNLVYSSLDSHSFCKELVVFFSTSSNQPHSFNTAFQQPPLSRYHPVNSYSVNPPFITLSTASTITTFYFIERFKTTIYLTLSFLKLYNINLTLRDLSLC